MKHIDELEVIASATDVVNEYNVATNPQAKQLVSELILNHHEGLFQTIEGFRTWARRYMESKGYMARYSTF